MLVHSGMAHAATANTDCAEAVSRVADCAFGRRRALGTPSGHAGAMLTKAHMHASTACGTAVWRAVLARSCNTQRPPRLHVLGGPTATCGYGKAARCTWRIEAPSSASNAGGDGNGPCATQLGSGPLAEVRRRTRIIIAREGVSLWVEYARALELNQLHENRSRPWQYGRHISSNHRHSPRTVPAQSPHSPRYSPRNNPR